MVGYYDELKSNRFCDPIKQRIILSKSEIFDENNSDNKLFDSSSSLLINDMFEILEEYGSIFPIYEFSTRSMISTPKSTGIQYNTTIEVRSLTSSTHMTNDG